MNTGIHTIQTMAQTSQPLIKKFRKHCRHTFISASFSLKIGRLWRCSRIDFFSFLPKDAFDPPRMFFFHSGISITGNPRELAANIGFSSAEIKQQNKYENPNQAMPLTLSKASLHTLNTKPKNLEKQQVQRVITSTLLT